jgi:hypothetical protein
LATNRASSLLRGPGTAAASAVAGVDGAVVAAGRCAELSRSLSNHAVVPRPPQMSRPSTTTRATIGVLRRRVGGGG